jgi:Arc/MetJ-type ribon-helix-helix transcriptional regulator
MRQLDPAPADTTTPAETQAVENRIQFVLSPRHLQILDDLCYHTRRATSYKLNRSEVVRALIELLGDKEVNYQQIRSEDDFRKYLHELLSS